MKEEYIIVDDLSSFDIRQILDCGQIFRYAKTGEGEYVVFSGSKRLSVKQDGEKADICGDREFARRFFDLERDYGAIKERLSGLPFMKESIAYGSGIRILNNDPFEMIISFIISANNHIPRNRAGRDPYGTLQRALQSDPERGTLPGSGSRHYTGRSSEYRSGSPVYVCAAVGRL